MRTAFSPDPDGEPRLVLVFGASGTVGAHLAPAHLAPALLRAASRSRAALEARFAGAHFGHRHAAGPQALAGPAAREQVFGLRILFRRMTEAIARRAELLERHNPHPTRGLRDQAPAQTPGQAPSQAPSQERSQAGASTSPCISTRPLPERFTT